MGDRSPTLPTIAERYEIERELGRGGMAVVYLAHDRKHDRRVAVKLLAPEVSQSLDARRFQREITITAGLAHPNILPLHDSGNANGQLYYVMPFVAGESLRHRLARERQLPLHDAVCIARAVAAALEHAHAHGVIHRDVKPENILLADGQAVVADFGIAKLVSETAAQRFTTAGAHLGTPAYMSPEQASGEATVDGRADLYAVGCVLYEMLTGDPPFTGTALAVLAQRVAIAAPDVRLTRDTVPEALATTVARALARSPADRFQTAAELGQALDEAALECAPRSPTGSARADRSASRWSATRRAMLAGALVAAGAAAAAGVGRALRLGPFSRAAGGPPTIHTLAVLPLASVSDAKGPDFFADGLTDALITGLSELGNVNVISRTSVMRYRTMPEPLPRVARALHADAVLEGTVVHSGARVRISTELIRASDQRVIWARSFERTVGDALALQADVAEAVAQEIGVRLGSDAVRRPTPVKLEAQEAYLKGQYYAGQWRLAEAIDAFQRAVAIDPNHAAAYAALARAYYFRAFFGEIAPAEAFSQMRRAASQALTLDPSSAEANGLMALVETHYDWDWAAAERHFRRALALSPSDAQVHHDYAHFLLAAGRQPESVAETKRALELDPANPMLTSCVGWHSLFDREFDQAISYARESQRMMPSFWARIVLGWAYLGEGRSDSAVAEMRVAVAESHDLPFAQAALAHALAKAGRSAEARRILSELLQRSLRGYVSAYDIAVVYAGLGDHDRAIDWLRKAIGERSMFVVHLTWDSRLDDLRTDPRFTALEEQLRKMTGEAAPKTAPSRAAVPPRPGTRGAVTG